MMRRTAPLAPFPPTSATALCHWLGSIGVAAALLIQTPGTQAAPPTAPDLLLAARQWRAQEGLAVATQRLQQALLDLDGSHGVFAQRLMQANADPDYLPADALLRLSPAERQSTAFYLVLGYQQSRGRSPKIIHATAQALQELGFHAVAVPAGERSSSPENAVQLADFLEKDLPKVKRAILVGFSKGAQDLICLLSGPVATLPEAQRQKIRLLVNCSGVVRGSCVADWAAHDHDPRAYGFRVFLNLKSARPLQSFHDLDSISRDPWQCQPDLNLRRYCPHLHSISFPALPEGADGRTHQDPLFSRLGRWCEDRQRRPGPCDGLVETAASILPPAAGLPQWIVPVRGSHSLLDGHYLNGRPIAPAYARRATRPQSGVQFMQDFIRALPQHIVGW